MKLPFDFNNYKKIYVFSNVPYNKKNTLNISSDSLAIFFNKAYNIQSYTQCDRLLIRRHDVKCFGDKNPHVFNITMFYSNKYSTLENLNQFFDKQIFKKIYDLPSKTNATGGFTTGYLTVKYLMEKYPNIQLYLINFGQKLKSKYNLITVHDWKWQDNDLKNIPHIFLD